MYDLSNLKGRYEVLSTTNIIDILVSNQEVLNFSAQEIKRISSDEAVQDFIFVSLNEGFEALEPLEIVEDTTNLCDIENLQLVETNASTNKLEPLDIITKMNELKAIEPIDPLLTSANVNTIDLIEYLADKLHLYLEGK